LYSGENRRRVCLVITSLQIGQYFTDRSGIREQRQTYLSNRVFESYDAICEACCQVWRKLTAEAGRIRTIATRTWATIGQNP